MTGSTGSTYATLCSLLARPSMICFLSVYKYIQQIGSSRGVFWVTVRDELRSFQGRMVLLVAEWDRSWLPLALASDASEWGYGVTSMAAVPSEIARVGRNAERSRFKHDGVLGARAAPFRAAGDLERWASAVSADQQSLRVALPEGTENWELDDRFPEIPGEWRAKSRWMVLRGRPWRREENILLLEARALCTAVQIGCSPAGAGGGRLLCLVNMALCLSVGRSRARKVKLLRILRIIAGWALAFAVSLSVGWVPSEYNTSDEPSRGEERLEQHQHSMSASTPSSQRTECSPRVSDLHSVPSLQPHRNSMTSKR